MKYVVCTIYDKQVGLFNRPFFAQSRGSAARSFMDEAKREHNENMLNQHPEDFTLFDLGSWDEESAEFNLRAQPDPIIKGIDL